MNKLHQEILKQLRKVSGKPGKLPPHYGGNKDPKLYINNPTAHQIAKDFVKKHPDLNLKQLTQLITSLVNGKYDDEKCLPGKIISRYPKLKQQINPLLIDQWLNNLTGWSQIDSLCQSTFSADDLLVNWSNWKKLILKLSKDKNINKRRASLVLLTGPVRQSSDLRFVNLSFQIIDQLKSEREILITKTVSWLLREMTKLHHQKVSDYLVINHFPLKQEENKLFFT